MARSLLARRVPQLTGIYLVASWGLLEFVDWAVDQYALSPVLTNFVVTLLVLLLPMVVVLAWRHGAPGADRWTRIDGAAIGLNLAAAAGILFVAFSGQELGAATTVKVVEDEAGNTVERVVPKAAFRRNVLLYDFDNESGDPELDWLRTGIVIGVSFDLFQDLFMTCLTVDDAGTVRERLAEAGFDLTDNIPLSLKREAAERRSVGHFMGGAVRTDGDTLVIETRLYETRNARLVATRTYRGTDPLELADRISVDFRRDLGIPDWQIEESVDLPAAELLTHSPDAFRSFSKVLVATRSNDLVAARSLAEEAVARDSTFALAHLWVSIIALLSGDQAAAGTLMAEATRHAYRLPERARLSVQVVDQLYYKQDPEAAIRAARYWTEIYPQDAEARRQLAGIYASTGDMDGQLAQYRALLAIDSADVGTMRQMASVFRAREEYDSAFVYYEHLGDRRPTDIRTRLDIAGTLLSLVKYAEAREELERARVAAPDEPDVLNQLARLDMREGRYEDAARRVEQMTSLGRTPQERHASVGLEETLYYERGQFARLEDAYRRRLATLAEYQSPIDVVGQMDNSELFIYAAEGGREAYALQQIDSLRNSGWPSYAQRGAGLEPGEHGLHHLGRRANRGAGGRELPPCARELRRGKRSRTARLAVPRNPAPLPHIARAVERRGRRGRLATRACPGTGRVPARCGSVPRGPGPDGGRRRGTRGRGRDLVRGGSGPPPLTRGPGATAGPAGRVGESARGAGQRPPLLSPPLSPRHPARRRASNRKRPA
jgi:tetratricopeptide (TPR) repeat protein